MYASAPVASKVTTVLRDSPAGITTSVGRVGWRSSVAVRWTAWTASSPTIHSWSIGSRLRSVIVTGTPTGTEICAGSKRE